MPFVQFKKRKLYKWYQTLQRTAYEITKMYLMAAEKRYYVVFILFLLSWRLLVQSQQERCEICSKLTIKTPEQNDVILVSLLLTLNRFHKLFWCLHC